MRHSAYTAASLHPVRTGLVLAAAAAGWAIATGGGTALLRRGRTLLDNARGGDGMSDADIEVEIRTQPVYDAPLTDVTLEADREEAHLMDEAAVGDGYRR